MVNNIIKFSIKAIRRNRSFTLISIAGFTISITVFILTMAFVSFETSFDEFHSKEDRIYRVLTEHHHTSGKFLGSEVPAPVPHVLKSNFDGVEKAAGVFASTNDQVYVLDSDGKVVHRYKEHTGVFAMEPEFFEIFDFQWVAGNPKSSLTDLNSAVLTVSTAEKYFGTWQNALGRTINLNNYFVLRITGILKDPPANTDFQMKIVTPYASFGISKTDWEMNSDRHACYILLSPSSSHKAFEDGFSKFTSSVRTNQSTDRFVLQPINEMHFTIDQARNFLGRTISRNVITAFWAISLLVLAVACINFINLATAQSAARSKEIGIKKMLGSGTWRIKLQFLTETFILILCSVLVSIVIGGLMLERISHTLDISLSVEIFKQPIFLLSVCAVAVAATLLAGSYPAYFISNYTPLLLAKGTSTKGPRSSTWLRRGLVVFQFVVAQALLITMLVMIKQMNHFQNESMGFTKDAIVVIELPSGSKWRNKLPMIREELYNINEISNVSFCSAPPASSVNNWTPFQFNNTTVAAGEFCISKYADTSYIKLYDLQLVAGRNLKGDTSREFLINEQMLKVLNLANANDALNKQLRLGDYITGSIVGVIKNFHSISLKEGVSPLFVASYEPEYRFATIKLNGNRPKMALQTMEAIWGKAFPDEIFEFSFLDDQIQKMYKQETLQTQIYKSLTLVAMFLGVLGLLGLVSFMVAKRMKELSVRKILGASAADIMLLFVREFLLLSLVAFSIAAPVAWIFVNRWLQDYASRINIDWAIFAAGAFLTAILVIVTVFINTYRVSIARPVDILREN